MQYAIAALAAYLIGSFPTGVIASKLVGSTDVRYVGSGHTGGTNTMRQAGPWVGAAVVIIDALKGIVAWILAVLMTQGDPLQWALPLAATFAVIGHCWPVYTRFHGGMGLATAGGIMLFTSPWTLLISIPIWAVFYLVIFKKHYSPRSVILAIAGAVIISVLFLPLAMDVRWMLGLMAVVLIIRHLPEWNRVE